MGTRLTTKGKAIQPVRRQLKKGELLFEEGDGSKSMYVIRAGMLRVFKKKGKSDIEIDTIRTGQIIGELAFLDGNPRSASAEALTDTTLLEISSEAFSSAFEIMPDWLKLLLKTVVGRLRSASTRIRQLEQASTQVSYSSTGSRESQYVFLPTSDVLKVCTALLLVGSRGKKAEEGGTSVRVTVLQRYANQVMNVPVAKITSILDILSQSKIISLDDSAGNGVRLLSPDFLEEFIAYMNSENLLEASKQHNISFKGLLIMGLIFRNLKRFSEEQGDEMITVNLSDVITVETTKTGKRPFALEECYELIDLGYLTQMNIQGEDSALTTLNVAEFKHRYRLQKLVKAIEAANNEKKNHGHGIAA